MSAKKQGSRTSGARKPAPRRKTAASKATSKAQTAEHIRQGDVCGAEIAGAFVCEREPGHDGRHQATVVKDGKRISWKDGDGSYRSESID